MLTFDFSYVLLLFLLYHYIKVCNLFPIANNNNAPCILKNNETGNCVSLSTCPNIKNEETSLNQCIPNKICCKVLSRIVTPDSGTAPAPSAPAGVGAAPPSGGGAPAGGSRPPNGGPPPNNGGSPPPSGGPPALSGSIMVDPNESTNNQSLDDDAESIVVSAEVTNGDLFERRCEMYHSTLLNQNEQIMIDQENNTAITPTVAGPTPIVMIYGGTASIDKEFPHMTALGYGETNKKQFLCGGSLITENFVVTAAHCITVSNIGDVKYVKLGTLNLNQDTSNTQIANVIRKFSHENYDVKTKYNDIAVLKLDHAIKITDFVRPICLFSSLSYEDKNLYATGWGKTEDDLLSQDLHKVGLELFTQTECQNSYNAVSKEQLPFGIQENIQICAGSHTESKDTCQGDSGGPLQIRKNNRWYLIGITSIGLQCGTIGTPGVYTRVAPYLPWIEEKLSLK